MTKRFFKPDEGNLERLGLFQDPSTRTDWTAKHGRGINSSQTSKALKPGAGSRSGSNGGGVRAKTSNNASDIKAGDAAADLDGRPTSELMLRKLAHELRTPIGAIISRAEVLRNESYGPLGDANYHIYADVIHDSASHALSVLMRVIEEVADSGSAENGAAEEVDLADLARFSVEILADYASDAQVDVSIDDAPDACNIVADPLAITQILINVLRNAIKFTPSNGEVKVSFELGPDSVTLRVVDNGIGIGPVELENINAAGSAQGFGYDIVHSLASRCNASLRIESSRNLGTTVSIEFARSESEPA